MSVNIFCKISTQHMDHLNILKFAPIILLYFNANFVSIAPLGPLLSLILGPYPPLFQFYEQIGISVLSHHYLLMSITKPSVLGINTTLWISAYFNLIIGRHLSYL